MTTPEAPGSGLFARYFHGEAAGRQSVRFGYLFAALAATVSGISVYVNSLGVQSFTDPVLYTALKDGFVGLVLLPPLLFSAGWRAEYRRLDGRTWAWMIALAVTGGSVPFALFFTGLQMTTAATGAVINHFQFVLVALFALVFLKEPIRPAMWAGFAVLLLGTMLGSNLHALKLNEGALLIAASTVLFAADFVIAKHLLRGLATLTVMTARMTIGTAMLFAYVIAGARLAPAAHLSASQWQFVVATGLLLLLFTVTTFTAIRHAPVSAVLAIGTAAPIITTLLQVARTGQLKLASSDLPGLAVILLAVIAIIVTGLRQDGRASVGAPTGQRLLGAAYASRSSAG
ncbi:MAG TPA: DMT family transporter [Chloroflexota bacterium]|nr:DMT family transporter [Chloroflexota bacterium]